MVTLVTALSLSLAVVVSLSPCCHLFAGLIIPPAHASVADTVHHHGGAHHDDRGAAKEQGPCSPQLDLNFVLPDLASAASVPQLDAAVVADSTAPRRVALPRYTGHLNLHGPPPARPAFLLFLRFLD